MNTGYLASFEPAMRAAIGQAAAAGRTDVPVGAVILDAAGTVIAGAGNRREADRDPTAHAEIVAIRAAARLVGNWRLSGCALVVTLEPCTMCAGAVLAARLGALVYGAADPQAGAAGSRWDLLHDRRLGSGRGRTPRKREGATPPWVHVHLHRHRHSAQPAADVPIRILNVFKRSSREAMPDPQSTAFFLLMVAAFAGLTWWLAVSGSWLLRPDRVPHVRPRPRCSAWPGSTSATTTTRTGRRPTRT